jgi:DNA-binding transcriptional MerR regulator
VQVRTLAEAGVPLAEVTDLLEADAERFARALDDVEHRLDARIEVLAARRAMVRRLADGDRALLPDRACAVLDRHTELGFAPEYVHDQREGLVLACSLAPEFFEGYLTQLEHRLDDPEYVELQKRGWEAGTSWDRDDPRLADLATAFVENLLSRRDLMEAQADFFTTPDALARYQMLNNHRADELPMLARLTELVEARLRAAGLSVPNQ